MELGFWNVIIYVVPALALVFFLFKGSDSHKSDWVDHNLYKNYRKTRMDKPIL